MLDKILKAWHDYVTGGFILVAVYLIAVHPAAFTGLVKTGFSGVNTSFKTLQGRG